MTTATLTPTPLFRACGNDGQPLAFGQLFTYAAGSSTPQVTYTDASGVIPNPNPIILNARGEANIWLPPNMAYKYVLAFPLDSNPPANPIWTVDNIQNSALLTLYAGVDTGSTNAYILNFTANFSTYTDGTVLFWTPSHTNTGPSTLNVNSLGVVSIVNGDGSATFAGEIQANQTSQVIYQNGKFLLITPAIASTNTFTPVYTGFSSAAGLPTSVGYRITGNIAAITIGGVNSVATSNGTAFTVTGIPAALQPRVTQQLVPCLGLIDNGSVVTTPSVALIIGGGAISFFKDASQPAWTASGNKGFASPISLVFPL